MDDIRGYNVLNGSMATMWWNGKPVYECMAVNADVLLNRNEVLIGMDVDKKLTSAGGELTLKIYHVYTRVAEEMQDAIRQGHDPRGVLRSRIADPDAVGKQAESVVLNNVWLDKYPLIAWERGNTEAQEITGGFTPTHAQITEAIREIAA